MISPVIPDSFVSAFRVRAYIDSAWDGIPTVTAWGDIIGTLSDQTDLQAALDDKQPIFETASDETADFTLDVTQAWKVVNCDTVSSLIITVPDNATEPFNIGDEIIISASGAGLVYFEPDGGVTIDSLENKLGILALNGVVKLQKTATNTWLLYGDLRVALDADAEAYINAVVATGVSFSDAEMGYINDWFIAAKANGYYSKYHAVYLFLGGTAAAHKFNAINPLDTDAAFRMVFTASPTHLACIKRIIPVINQLDILSDQ